MTNYKNFSSDFTGYLGNILNFLCEEKIDLSHLELPSDKHNAKKFIIANRLNFVCVKYFIEETKDLFGCATAAEWVSQEKLYRNNLNQAISLISKRISYKKWILIKTVSSHPHFTSDIDVMVKDFSSRDLVNDLNPKLQYNSIQNGISKRDKIKVFIDGQVGISWTNTPDISNEFIWKNTKAITLGSRKVTIPNENLDFLMRLGHIPFELAEFRLGEFIHLLDLSSKVDFELIKQEAKNCGWPSTYRHALRKFDQLSKMMVVSGQESNTVSDDTKKYTFPHRYSYLKLALAVIEKRSWKKLLGARYLIKDRLFD